MSNPFTRTRCGGLSLGFPLFDPITNSPAGTRTNSKAAPCTWTCVMPCAAAAVEARNTNRNGLNRSVVIVAESVHTEDDYAAVLVPVFPRRAGAAVSRHARRARFQLSEYIAPVSRSEVASGLASLPPGSFISNERSRSPAGLPRAPRAFPLLGQMKYLLCFQRGT